MPTKEEYWKHRDYYRSAKENERCNRLIKKYMAEGRCRCGRELIEGANTGRHCVVCAEGGIERKNISRYFKTGGE